jgi:hypothetical protein
LLDEAVRFLCTQSCLEFVTESLQHTRSVAAKQIAAKNMIACTHWVPHTPNLRVGFLVMNDYHEIR